MSLIRWNYKLDNSPMQVINSFLHFEADIRHKDPTNVPKSNLITKAMKHFLVMGEVTVASLPVLQFLMLTYRPCTPPFLMSMIPSCIVVSKQQRIIGVIIRSPETWMGWHILYFGSMWLLFELFVGIDCILSYLRFLESQIQSVRNEDDADDCIQFYRAIQVLEKYFNACPHIKRIIPLTVFITPTLQIITQYVCISLRDAVPLPGFLVFPLIAADTIINNVLILTLGSGVHSGSQKALQLLNRRKQRGLKPDRIIRRKVKSCSLLKIRFGSNFIDRGTPLKVQGFIFFVLYVGQAIIRWNYDLDNSGIQIINAFMDFESHLTWDFLSSKSKVANMMQKFLFLGEISLPVIPILQFILLIYKPCTPPFIMSMSANCNTTQSVHSCNSIVGILVNVLELWMALHTLYSGSIWVYFALCAGIGCFLYYLNVIHSQLVSIRTKHDLKECIRLYKALQVLEKSFNAFIMNRVLPTAITLVPGLQIVAQYVCIRLNTEIPMPGFLVFPLIGVNAIIYDILIFTVASSVHNLSQDILQSFCRKISGISMDPVERRRTKCCSVLKIKFGSNFIDRGTPLVIQDFCMNQTVNLVLIK
ncbi:hypothetical protein Fcan01_01536 [Folsomia candida]|uniref:Uncharacterized protein n=1 Tax=Folsomia candida TaxID=158441 RepID=A0A226EY54_FOLCA|nr:hypothetical protein Fcan01_01536 [Folsomia candida]